MLNLKNLKLAMVFSLAVTPSIVNASLIGDTITYEGFGEYIWRFVRFGTG